MSAPPWPGEREWTPAAAAAALPLVRRIAADLASAYAGWRDAVAAFEHVAGASRASAPSAEADRLMDDAQRLAGDIDALRGELARLDIRVAQLEPVVLAFRALRSRRVVPLYWSPGGDAPSRDWPAGVPAKGTPTSWPSRAHDVAAKSSRA